MFIVQLCMPNGSTAARSGNVFFACDKWQKILLQGEPEALGRGQGKTGKGEKKRNTQLQRDTALALQLPVWIGTRWHAGTPAWLSEEPSIWLMVGREGLGARALPMVHITDFNSVSLHRKPKCLIPTAGAGRGRSRRTFNSLLALDGGNDIIGRLKMSSVEKYVVEATLF